LSFIADKTCAGRSAPTCSAEGGPFRGSRSLWPPPSNRCADQWGAATVDPSTHRAAQSAGGRCIPRNGRRPTPSRWAS